MGSVDRLGFQEVVPSPPASPPEENAGDLDLSARLYASASTAHTLAHIPSSALQAMKVGPPSPRKAKYGGGKTSTSAVLGGHSTFTTPLRAPPAAPVSGSMASSGQIAPRMKLVRRASRDLESRQAPTSVNERISSCPTFYHQAESSMDCVPHGGFLKSLQTSPLWKDPFRNPNVFLYLTADSENPYKLTIVDSVDPSSDKFYTLSMNGLVWSTRDRTEFVTVEQFERQYMQYHRIAALPFFKQYSQWKSFAEWKSFVRIRKRAKCRTVLEEDLFTLHPWLRIGIRRLKELCHELSTRRAFKVDFGTHTLEEFCDAQSAQRDHLDLELQQFSLNVREAVMKSCEDTLYNFLHKAGFNVKASTPEEARELLMKTMEEVNPSEISFTERAAMRTQCRKLAKFMKVADFLVADTYLDVALESTRDLLLQMQHAVDSTSDKDVSNLQPIKEEGNLSSQKFPVMLFDGLTVVANPCRLLSEPSFKAFVSPIVDERGMFAEGQDLEAAIMEDPDFQEMLECIHRSIAHSFRRTETYASSFDTLTQCYLENAQFARDVSVSSYVNANVEQLKALLFNYDDQTTRFKRIKTWQDVGLIRVGSAKLEALLRPSPERCLEIVHRVVPQLYKINHELLLNELSESLDAMSKKSRSVEDFANLIVQYRGAKERAGEMQERYTFLSSLYEVMEGNGVAISDDTRTAANMIVKLRKQLHSKIEMVESIYDQEHQKFSSELGKQAASLTPRIQALRMDLGHGMIQNPAAEVAEVVEYLIACEKTLASLYTLADCLISWQSILQTGSFDRDELEEIESEMSQKTRLWRGIQTFEERLETWENTSFEALDIESMEAEIIRFWRIVQLSEKQLPTNPAVGRLKHMVEEVKLTVPVVADLRSGALMDRHWEALDDILGMDVREQGTVTFKQMMEADLKEVSEQVNSVVSNAEQESILARLLQKVQDTWADATFQLKPHGEKIDVVILSDVDELTTRVDDSVVTIGNILASPHVGPIRLEAEEFAGTLNLLQATLEEWLVLQRTWGYISSIFAAPDIQKQLPGEARAFRAVDAFFKDTMKKTAEHPHCLTAGTAPNLMDNFKRNNEILEGIAKGLETFLEVKRQAFPRFYFLADDELLDLLSRCRDTSAVQPHMRKCFDAVHSLDFGDGLSSNTINAMVSREGEYVPLGPNLKARGALEDWLTAMEESMRKVLHRFIKIALTELEGINFYGGLGRVRTKRPSRNLQNTAEARVAWALEGQPAQIAATVVQICWTRATEQAMSRELTGESGAMQTWLDTSFTGLHALVGRIQEKMTPLQRTLAVALVTAEVHNRDVVEVLVNKEVSNPQNFLWQAQLRFYWEADTVKVQQSTAKMQYGYEYQGATTRLVITPLTERCWMTITGALDLKLGANPIGPAGTGKTESTKDLAKGLGTQCIVFNCSDQIDHTMPARLFSGLVQTGAWTCLDEFNRINIEVLSVIAEQLMVLRNARLAGATKVMFEGRELPLKDHHVVVTMNPGYYGRTELPNNLQTCFRPVAMMVPDYSLISEIILYSEGFEHAKALCSSNLPKLLERDTPLFVAILGDLFPRKALPMPSHDSLHRGVAAAAKKTGLQLLEEQTTKIDQLHETMEVRFGVALVGHAGAGKSALLRLLAEGSTWLRNEELQQIAVANHATVEQNRADGDDPVSVSDDASWLSPARGYTEKEDNCVEQSEQDLEDKIKTKWSQVKLDVLNPKSITVGELYGQFNPFTMEWRDGVGSSLMRRAATDSKVSTEYWIVFDGPIDVVWIESMNTALDDNLMLCLASGERVKLRSDSMRLIFEVEDLLQASPATVSRLGVVYVPRRCVPASSAFRTWLDGPGLGVLGGAGIPSSSKTKSRLSELAKKLMWPTLEYMAGRGDAVFREEVVTLQVQRVQSFCVFFEGILARQRELHARAAKVVAEQAAMDTSISPRKGGPGAFDSTEDDVGGGTGAFGGGFAPSLGEIDQTFMFAMIWGLGGGLTGDPALAFDVYVRDLVQTSGFYNSINLPPNGSIFEYYAHFYPPGQGGVRPYEWRSWTVDVPSFEYPPNVPVYKMMVPTANTERYSFLLETNLGAGRPTFLAGATGAGKTMLAAQPVVVNMSARSSSHGVQTALESKMVSVHKDLLGAPEGKTNVVFVDDVNLPARDTFDSQPPVELLRQLVSQGGFYDRERLFWRSVRDTVVAVAAAPPGGARSAPSARFSRLFSILCLPTQCPTSITAIFGSILKGFLGTGFLSAVASLSDALVSAMLEVYSNVEREMLPTPSRPHYTFNLRDISKVVQGIVLVKHQSIQAPAGMVRLWMHEMSRVFGDRLADPPHRVMFEHTLIEAAGRHFKMTGPGWQRDDLFEMRDPKPGEDYGQGESVLLFGDVLSTGTVANERLYEECSDLRRVVRQLNFYQDEYNVGGSGRESLTTLATSMAGSTLVRVTMTHDYGVHKFEQDLKKAVLGAGIDAKHTVFLLKDAQILEESMLEDINCLLGSGEVPNLFTPDEEADLVIRVRDAVRATGSPDTKARCIAFFTEHVRDYLHVVLCLDPAGSSFRERVRNFPSLVNCSTIDWYNAWPRTALHSVAHRILAKLAVVPSGPQECGVGPKVAASLMKISVDVHGGVEPAAASFFSQLGRRIYVSPKSYLDFLRTFLNMLGERRRVLCTRLASLKDGVVKLEETGRIVNGLKRELTELQPLLEAKALEAEGLLNQVEEERKEAEAIKEKVAKDEAVVASRQEEISVLQQEAQKSLDQALPALEEAIKALNSLKRDDISEVKSFQNPPQAVQTVMNAVCLLLSEEQDWDSAKRVLSRNSFMDELRSYDKESLTAERRKSLKRYVDDENMSVDRLRKVSLAAAGMCMWVHAMDQYADIFEEVKPRMDTVQVLNQELEQANSILRTKRSEVQRIEEEVALLMQSGEEANQEKNGLENEIKRCIQRLDRAEKLTSGLEEENKRWTATAQDILDHEVNLTGDIFLSAAFLSYLGAFTGPFRNSLVASWTVMLRDKGVRVSDGFSLAQVLIRPVLLREWHLQGLPSDKTSVESAIAATTVATGRWPLLIDPQRQACRWLKYKEAAKNSLPAAETTDTGYAAGEGLLCVNTGSPSLLSNLQVAVGEGRSLLVEDIETSIDPVLDPVICHRTFMKGGRTMLPLGDVEVEYNANFRLFLTTELSNPHFQADTAIRVNLINFTVTRRGLEDQLLCEVVTLEQPELEERHHDLVTSIATDQKQLLDIEDQILRLLNEAGSGVEVLDDETLITTLSKSKTMSKAIAQRLADSKSTKRQIEESRERYRPVAVRGSLLYFTVADLCRVDIMYQFSLEYFQLLFTNCIVDTLDAGHGGLSTRLQLLLEKSTEAVYRAISRGLFERHKLPFAFMICTGILRATGDITADEWVLLLQGARPNFRRRTSRGRESDQRSNQVAGNPDPTTLDERSWKTLQQAEVSIPSMKGICTSVAESWPQWQDWRADSAAHRAPLPSGWEEKLNRFQKMIVVRALAEANTHGAAADLVEYHLGRELIRPSGTAAGVEEVFADVDEKTPCVFILSRGSDPMALLMKFAASMGMENQLELVSLGKGQGPRAEEVIKVARASGGWVMLQNCHLACSWLPTLDSIVKSLGSSSGNSKAGFRFFLSAAPVPYFPAGVLQRSVKVTDEPPRGIQANLRRSYNMQMSGILSREQEEGVQRPPEWKRLLFGLCFFHAVVQERVKFGPLGWNVTYNFGDSDLDAAFKLLGRFVDDLYVDTSMPTLAALPVESLVYVTGNITYGGWVTDEWDRRCLLAVLDHFYSASIFGDAAHMYSGLSSSPEARASTEDGEGPSKAKARLVRRLSASSAMIAAAPVDAPTVSYLTYIEHIPPEDGPQMFGMHASADISLRLKESKALLDSVLALQPRDANTSAGQRPDDVVLAVTQEVIAKTPGSLKHRKEGAVNHLTRRGSSVEPGVSNTDSLVTVLVQELDNCNSLLEVVRTTVEQLVLAVKGEIVMSPELDKVYSQFLVNHVPAEWRRRGFASLKPLGSWMKDLRWRVRFFELWLERGNPYAFSLPAFFFPQGFLTAVLQNHARKHAVPVNLLGFKYNFPDILQPEHATRHPADGVLVYGMHIEGASWDHATKRLCDPRPDQMRAPAPIVHFLPETDHEPNPADYVCPTYKTSERRGELSTTGISTNFVVAVEFLTDMPVRQFILHGAAMLLSLES
eukprot:g16249.t1